MNALSKWMAANKGVLFVLVAAGLLVLLLYPRVVGDASRHEATRAHLEAMTVAQSRFQELVISLRHGIGSNYDEANGWLERAQAEQAELSRLIGDDAALLPLWREYTRSTEARMVRWNDFKRRNALVRNSLRYFQSDALGFARELPAPATSLQVNLMALNNGLILAALGEGVEGTNATHRLLQKVRAAQALVPTGMRAEFLRLLRHAEIISRNGPALAADVRGLMHGASRNALNRLTSANHERLIARQIQASRQRSVLLASVFILLLGIAFLLARYYDSLRRNADQHRLAGTVFTSSQQGILITDAQGRIVQVNPAYCRITGYAEHELIGQNPRMLRSGLHGEAFYLSLWDSLETYGCWQGEIQNRRKNGDIYVQWSNIDAVTTAEGEKFYVGIVTDISELVHSRERLANLAYYDTLTGLPNRALFHDRLRQSMVQTRREHEVMALIFADLDNFKLVNDSLGHAAGDELLRVVADRLSYCVRESDTVARLGGDEFAIILSDVKGAEECAHIAANILKSLAAPCAVLGSEVVSGASLGITFYPIDGEREEDLLKHADVAMYRAKERGKNAYQFFTDDMAATVAESLRIESGLRHALEAGELSLAYQPQVSHRGEVIGAEALMRWYSPELGHVPPARFIPIAEKSGLIWDLGDFAIREACRQCAAWRERLFPGFRISVNLSAAQFRNEGLVGRVAETLCDFGLDGTALELEITESVVMDDVGRGLEVLERLKRLGCRLAIDDFGTGYSSLAYLKRFQVDVLKIDKSFVDGLGSGADANSDDLAVVQAVLSLARSLRLEVVAEGVETDEQFSCLKGLAGAEGFLAQGYLYSPPLPAPAFEQLYADLERDVPKLCAAL